MSELQQSREEKILANKNLVHHVLKKYSIRTDDYDDVAQIGMIGLIKAVDTFDESRNFKFATYACRVIRNEIGMYLRKNKKYAKDVSMNTVISNPQKEELTLEDAIPDDSMPISEMLDEQQHIEYVISIMLNYFSKRETVTFLYLIAGMPQEEIAKHFEISRSYVSRIVGKIRIRLKEYAEKEEMNSTRRGFFVKYSPECFAVMFYITDVSAFIHSCQMALSLNTKVQDEAKSEFKITYEGNKVTISFPMEFEYFSLLADIFWRDEEFEEKFQDYREEIRQKERERREEEARLKREEADKKRSTSEKLQKARKESSKGTKNEVLKKADYGSITRQIKSYMLMRGEFEVSDLKRIFSDISPSTINYVIRSMKRKKVIEKIAYGKYRVIKSEVEEEK